MTGVARSRARLALTCASLAASLALWTAPSAAAVPAATLGQIDDHVGEALDANWVPGASLAITDAERTIHARGFGKTGRGEEAVAEGTPFLIGSVSKSFTALATLQLVEAGRVELDAPLDRYLPWFEVAEEPSSPVTVRTLLNQTSGLPTVAGGRALRFVESRPVAETARALVGAELTEPPGERFQYSNANYVLLGALIEAVSGGSYGEYLREEVLEPLGMNHTYTSLEQARAGGLAEGHRYWFGLRRAHTTWSPAMVPAGAIASTAPDMARYMRMLLNGGRLGDERVLSPAGVETLMEPAAPATVGPWAKGDRVAYGMGLYVGREPFGAEPAAFHPGGSPDFGSMMVLFPERELGSMLMVNVTPEIDLPGAAGAIDRIGAGAASILVGAEPAEGPSLSTYYPLFDLIALVLIAALGWVFVRGLRRRQQRPRSRARRVLGLAGAVLALAAGVLLLAVPALGVGWEVLLLALPDLAVVLAVVGVLLLANGAVRLLRIPGADPS